MLRLTPPDGLRLRQAVSLGVTFGGAEANVAVSLAQFGVEAAFVTRLPDNDLGDACLEAVRHWGVDMTPTLRGGDRLGLYYLEMGAMQRGPRVIYDRAHSAFAQLEPGMIDWPAALAGADWFHWSGITPALTPGTAAACLEAVQAARALGLTVSCDPNYRASLWRWGQPPAAVLPDMVRLCDVVIAGEGDAGLLFGLDWQAPPGSADERFASLCAALHGHFPNLKTIATTFRGSLSASHHTLSGVLWHQDTLYTGPRYDLTHIVDRVGGGDAFMAGLIYGLLTRPDTPQYALDFGLAAACLKHGIYGDFNLVSTAEVTRLMEGDSAGRVSR
jgi:2-dehydro-3-deoxygluconokinase